MVSPLKPIVNALTVDVEDYFMVSAFSDVVKPEEWSTYESRVEANTNKVINLFAEYNIKATFFVLGWVAERYPQLIMNIHAAGHEVASHGYSHRLIYNLSQDEFREDISKSKKILEDIIGEPVTGFRAASYSLIKKTMWAIDILIEEGFRDDSSIFPVHHDVYGIPDFHRFPAIVKRDSGTLLEIPPSTIRLLGKNIPFSGGGYLRMLPIKLIELGINFINTVEGEPTTLYFHPWEIDSDQPRLDGRKLSVLRHYLNIDSTIPKLCRIMNKFKFSPIREVFAVKIAEAKSVVTI